MCLGRRSSHLAFTEYGRASTPFPSLPSFPYNKLTLHFPILQRHELPPIHPLPPPPSPLSPAKTTTNGTQSIINIRPPRNKTLPQTPQGPALPFSLYPDSSLGAHDTSPPVVLLNQHLSPDGPPPLRRSGQDKATDTSARRKELAAGGFSLRIWPLGSHGKGWRGGE